MWGARRSALIVTLAIAAALAGGGRAGGQSSARCTVPSFRGATSPGGGNGNMTVVNDGQPCTFTLYVDVERRIPPDELHVITPPANGSLTITPPGTVDYTPNPGFTGADRFVYGGSGRTPRGTRVDLHVTMAVTVLPRPAAPPRR